jgi:hypothetical protein
MTVAVLTSVVSFGTARVIERTSAERVRSAPRRVAVLTVADRVRSMTVAVLTAADSEKESAP